MLLPLAALSATLVAIMIRFGRLDHPVARSSHTNPTPKGGGIGIAAALLAGMALIPLARPDTVLAAAALGLAAVSYADDLWNLPFWIKMAAQSAAALAVIGLAGTPHAVAVPGLGMVDLSWMAPALSLVWLIYVTNAVNFMDGLNGLAAGSATIACLGVIAVEGVSAAWPESLLAAGIIGFLPFNFPRARIFMGDVGSQFLGVMLAGLALLHASDPRLSAVLPLALLPMLLDVALTLIRRWTRGERLTEPHRRHLYQMANRAGMPAWRVTLIYWLMAATGAALGGAAGATARAPRLSLGGLAAIFLTFLAWTLYVERRARKASC